MQNNFLRTLCGQGVDPCSDCSTNLRLDQKIIKLFETDLRLENIWKNIWSGVGEVGGKCQPWLKPRNIYLEFYLKFDHLP